MALANGLVTLADAIESEEAIEAIEYIERRLQKRGHSLSQELAHTLAEEQQNGVTPPYTFNSSSDYFVQGIAFIQPNDSEPDKVAKQRHALLYGPLVDTLGDMSSGDFELLCTSLLGELGVASPKHTKWANDGGVDAFGLLPVGTLLDNPIVASPTARMRMWVICQAKRYVGSVDVTVVRELIGSAIVLRNMRRDSPYVPEGFDVRACDPVCLMVMTTGKFTRDAASLLRESGVVGYDLDGLASFLSSHGVGWHEGGWNAKCFGDWLRQHGT